MRKVSVEAEIEIRDVLGEISTEELIDYVEGRGVSFNSTEKLDISDLVNSCYHGDFDLKALIKAYGVENIKRIIEEIEV